MFKLRKFFSLLQDYIVHLHCQRVTAHTVTVGPGTMNYSTHMNRILYFFAVVVAFTSCAESYNIQGASSVSSLDGSKLYLKGIKNNELTSIDSCEVIHGKFKFAGLLDTTMVVNLFMDEQSLMIPIVLEEGNISVRIDKGSCKVSGTHLNEVLYEFIDQHNQLDNRLNELDHRYSQMLLDAIDEETINEEISREASVIAMEEDSLVTHFIVDNFDNVLGPWGFMMLTGGFEYPMLTPQIDHIMSQAPDTFKNDPYVSRYYKAANEIEQRMQGMGDDSGQGTSAAELPDSVIQNMLNGKE